MVDDLEDQLTIYRDSEVSRLNASAHLGAVAVEAGLFDLLAKAIEIGHRTEGAYDVTSGALSIAWGFLRGPKRIPDAEALSDALSRTGSHHLTLDPANRSVSFDRAGIVVNFGGIGKGYAIDRATDVLRNHWWPTPGLVHGGQSSVFALGSPPDRFGGRWEIALRNPFDLESPLGTIRLRDRALGTSGSSFQNFEVDGRVFGHILDPRTGQPPSSGPASVTVLAPTAAEADAYSTAFFLLGPDGSRAILEKMPELGAIFVLGDAEKTRVVTINVTEDDFEVSTPEIAA